MTKHTPGPWYVDPEYSVDVQAGSGQDRVEVATAIYSGSSWCSNVPGLKTARANARLIAAAPDLLAALQLALKQLEALDDVLNQPNHEVVGWHMNGATEPVSNFFSENDHGAIETARTAIVRATGEQP